VRYPLGAPLRPLVVTKNYNDPVATTFLYIVIILCYVKRLNSSMSNFGGRLCQPKKMKLILGIFLFLPTYRVILNECDFFSYVGNIIVVYSAF
jgi:hypothetical protein